MRIGQGELLVPQGRTRIARDFSPAIAFVTSAAATVTGVVCLLLGCTAEEASETVIEAAASEDVASEEVEALDPPPARFTDVTAEAGIDFVHDNGAYGDKLLPETMGGGVAFFDYDGDGHQDLLFVNSSQWPPYVNPEHVNPETPSTMALYRNDGTGRFRDVTREAGLEVSFYGMGVAVADYDADGDRDVFFTAVGPNHLFRNDGGRFVDVTSEAGVAGGAREWSTAAGYFDYDGDDDLDLFVGNYLQWSKEIDFEIDFRLTGVGRAFGPPQHYQGTHPFLYRNDGGGTFTEVSSEAGLRVDHPATGAPMAKSLALGLVDFEGDGDMDVLVANDTVRNFFFLNQGAGTFVEAGEDVGLAYDSNGNATGAMGIDAAFVRNDHNLAFMVGSYANEMSTVYVAQDAPELFVDEAIGEGIGNPSYLMLTFGLLLFDYEHDGRLDMLQANGHVESAIAKAYPNQSYRQRSQLFWNAGDRGFVEVEPEQSGDLAREIVGRGASYADFDGDGDLDVVLTQIAGPPLLLRNDQDTGYHWLRVHLEGRAPNRDAIGSWIELEAGGLTQRRQVMPTRSYLSQVERTVTFGLGTTAEVDSLKVLWPGGSEQIVEVAGVDRLQVITQRP